MAITREQKKEILQELIEKFTKSKSVVFSEYRGLNVSGISDLRKQLRLKGAECKVAKKTLMRLAAKEINIDELSKDMMEGPVAAIFSYEDELAGLKILFKFSATNENLKLLGGIIDGKVVGKDEIIKLAKLPGREELLAKLIGSMNAPISGFVGILGNLLGGFVRVLNAYKDKMPAVAPIADPVAEPAVNKTEEVSGANPEAPLAEALLTEAPQANEEGKAV